MCLKETAQYFLGLKLLDLLFNKLNVMSYFTPCIVITRDGEKEGEEGEGGRNRTASEGKCHLVSQFVQVD